MVAESVVPIPPSYQRNEELDLISTQNYIKYLNDNNIQTIMTTAGTSQFNLMSQYEIHLFNYTVISNFVGKKIIGIPPLSTKEAIEFVRKSRAYIDKDTYMMVLYPDRFYSFESIYNHVKAIIEQEGVSIYLHAMFMRNGTGGFWNYTADIVSKLFQNKIICGIKEEHSNLQQSYNFIRNLPQELDIIVAGGSMRRHQFLRTAGANSFLSGVGNFFPKIENNYCIGHNVEHQIELESRLFDVFNKYGWHPCLRIGLSELNLGCFYDRMPFPERKQHIVYEVGKVLTGIKDAIR